MEHTNPKVIIIIMSMSIINMLRSLESSTLPNSIREL